MNQKTGYVIAGAILAAVGAFQVFAALTNDDEVDAVPTSPGTVQIAPTPTPTSTPTPPDGTPGSTLDQAFVEDVVHAYADFSWQDATPYAWMGRYGPFCTDDYADTLLTAYPFTKVDEVDWEMNVINPQAEGQATSIRKRILGGSAEEGEVSFKVTYATRIRYALPDKRGISHDGVAPAPVKPGQWLDGGTQQFTVVFVRDDDGLWKVSNQWRYTPERDGDGDGDRETG